MANTQLKKVVDNLYKESITINDKEVLEELEPIVEEGIKWLDENQNASTEEYDAKQKEIEAKTNPLMMKLYGNQAQGMPEEMPQNVPEDDLD